MNDVTEKLKGLVVPAPPGLAERVLAATGTGRFFDVIEGPTGELMVGWSEAGIFGIAPRFATEGFLAEHTKHGMAPIRAELPQQMKKRVLAAIDSGRLGKLPVDLSGLTDFQQAVLRKTAEIPPGELRPYGWVAREIGKPGATRAVGSALNKNPVPVLIPCHRVGKSDGTVGQYAYGAEMKRALLSHEGLDADEVDAVAARGVRFVGSKTSNIYCHLTCRHARRIGDHNRVEFGDVTSAVDAGMRACLVCRPPVAA